MRLLFTIVMALLAAAKCVQAGTPLGVFAHFMVGNTEKFTSEDWDNEMANAGRASIMGFALNMAADWPHNEAALELAFASAASHGLFLFFSFDYAGGGPWDQSVVTEYIKKWGSHKAYWQHAAGKPLVSTFEGPENAEDWIDIKAQTNCFFMPDWSSVGAGPAVKLAGGVADGLFSWAAWPWGTRKMDTYTDYSYIEALDGKPYMMAVSPWFYTNLPGYNKNWLWRGGNLWYERWQQAFTLQPEYIEIVSWNDFGESHYIGNLDIKQWDAFDVGKAPFNYAQNYDHSAWRLHLPFLIHTFLSGNIGFDKESMLVVYHANSLEKCGKGNDGGTTGNTVSQLQLEFAPEELSEDKFYIAALLGEPADFFVDGTAYSKDEWEHAPDGGVGLYWTSVPIGGPGLHRVGLRRGSSTKTIDVQFAYNCLDGMNWNTEIMSFEWDDFAIEKKLWRPELSIKERGCIKGWGAGDFNDLCEFTCKYDYCPSSCVCENTGAKIEKPPATGAPGFPANGDANYGGLCSFACDRGYCPSKYCSSTEQPQYIPTSSPFLPPTCIEGTSSNEYKGLCEYGCNFGFCPRHMCTCSKQGALILPPDITEEYSWKDFESLNDAGLCNFACSRGYCPDPCSSHLKTRIPPKNPISDAEREKAEVLYKGIDWTTAQDSCEDTQFETLVTAVDGALWLALATQNMLGEYDKPYKALAWSKYFGLRQIWETKNPERMHTISAYYEKVVNFIKNGPTSPDGHKIAFYCGDMGQYRKCGTTAKTVPAYTDINGMDPEVKDPFRGTSFCPPFFQQQHISTIISKANVNPIELNSPKMVPKEHSVLHEWMHNDYIIGLESQDKYPSQHISDMKLSSGINVYGATRCSDYAADAKSGELNLLASYNADNYAWVMTHTVFEATWMWNSLKRRVRALSPFARREEQQQQEERAKRIVEYFRRDFGTENKEWLESIKHRAGEFTSVAGCTLSMACHFPDKTGRVGEGCTCTCDEQQTFLNDTRCAWRYGKDLLVQPNEPLDLAKVAAEETPGVHACGYSH